MDPLVLAGATGGAALLVLAVTLGLLVPARHRAERRRVELEHSRAEVADLHERVDTLAGELERSRREEDRRRRLDELRAEQREYLITSLGVTRPALTEADPDDDRAPIGRAVQQRLVEALARHQDASAARERAVDLVVRTVALGHGVRRALSPDNLDRAAAEAHVARRRSRRVRRHELREARKLIRTVREHRSGGRSAA